jgi:polar amino acid transport system substrate-binding protein
MIARESRPAARPESFREETMKRPFPYLAAALAAFLFAASGAMAQEAKSRLDEILARGSLIVGTSSEAPPFGYIDEKGELVGFDVDIARLLAKAIVGDSSKVEFVRQSHAARWPNVDSGKVDFGIQVATIYPDRAVRVAFTRGYVDSGVTLLVKKESKIRKTADANGDKISVAHTGSPASRDRAKRYFPKAREVALDSTSAVFSAIKVGRVDAGQFDVPVARHLASKNPDVRVLEDWMTEPTNNGIFLKQGDFRLWLLLDTLVGEMRGGSLYGEYKAIHEKWFGVPPPHDKHYIKR